MYKLKSGRNEKMIFLCDRRDIEEEYSYKNFQDLSMKVTQRFSAIKRCK